MSIVLEQSEQSGYALVFTTNFTPQADSNGMDFKFISNLTQFGESDVNEVGDRIEFTLAAMGLTGPQTSTPLHFALQHGAWYALVANDESGTQIVSNIIPVVAPITLTQEGSILKFTTSVTVRADVNGNVFKLYYSITPFNRLFSSNLFPYASSSTADQYAFVSSQADGTVDLTSLPNGLQNGFYCALSAEAVTLATFEFTSNVVLYIKPTPSIITQAVVDDGFMLAAGKYTLGENVTVTQPFSADPGTIFDGSGHTITVDVDGWSGLFSAPVTVMNLTLTSSYNLFDTSNTGGTPPGWFFNGNDEGGVAYNCTNTCPISAGGGGIFGANSTGVAISCQNTGSIALAGGGIFGRDSAGTAVGCTNSGQLGNAGGIFGAASSGTAINCSNSGTFGGGGAGGIFNGNSTGMARNCFNTAPLFSNCGGIFGSNSTGTAANCYNSGDFGYLVELAGGIFGWESAGTAIHCYNVGDISGNVNSHIGVTNATFGPTQITGEITSISSGGSTEWSDVSAHQYLADMATVWVTVTPNTPFILSPFYTSIEGLLALFVAKPNAVVSLPRSMGIPDSEIAFATALTARNDSSKYGALSQLTAFMFTYTPTNATILYQDRNLGLSGPLNIIVPSYGIDVISIGIPL